MDGYASHGDEGNIASSSSPPPPRMRSYFATSAASSSIPQRRAHLASTAPRVTTSSAYQKSSQLSDSLLRRLDLACELGSPAGGYGHQGCVNALAWNKDGTQLASGSDDTCVLLWRVGTSHIHPPASRPTVAKRRPYIGAPAPFYSSSSDEDDDDEAASSFPALDLGLSSRIHTGHRGNIFDVAFAPGSSDRRIVTAAADAQIRVFDLERAGGERVNVGGKYYDDYHAGSGGVDCRTLKCHRGFAKRVVMENSPDVFLSVAEDGDVRQHDLRTHHICQPAPRYGFPSRDSSSCPRPLVHHSFPLFSLSVSPLQPWLFAVAGMSPYVYLYDRRMVGRVVQDEWGASGSATGQNDEDGLLARCVRRFGLPDGDWEDKHGDPARVQDSASNTDRRRERLGLNDHITAVQLGEERSNELLASYSGSRGAVYRFDIRDEPGVLMHRERSEDGDGEVGVKRGKKRTTSGRSASGEEASAAPSSSSAAVAEDQASAASHASSSRKQPRSSAGQRNASFSSSPSSHAPQQQESGNNDEEDGFATSSSSSDPDTPTEQERAGFPLYQQLLADGLGGELEGNDEDEELDAELDLEEDDLDEDGFTLERIIDDNEEEWDEDDDEEDEDLDEDDFTDDSDAEAAALGLPPVYRPDAAADRASDAQTSRAPITYPRQRYVGHLNVETVKDVTLLRGEGGGEEYVCSGSDDGHLFVWSRESGELVGLWEADGSVVNVVRQHPIWPVLAVSGIDDTVKIFAPRAEEPERDEEDGMGSSERRFGRPTRSRDHWESRREIVGANARRMHFAEFDDEYGEMESGEEEEEEEDGEDAGTPRRTPSQSSVSEDVFRQMLRAAAANAQRGGERDPRLPSWLDVERDEEGGVQFVMNDNPLRRDGGPGGQGQGGEECRVM